MLKQRKVPLRKCTGCQEMKNKKELVRIVRSEDGTFSLDVTGKKPGRGRCAFMRCCFYGSRTAIRRTPRGTA